MKTIIERKLTEIEQTHGIKILYSCESGSRAWGFPSPDSDYDVRFIYLCTLKDYLTIQPKKDHLSFPINNELDICGWDISKVLQLITKSNTTPFEWLQSPIIYRENQAHKEKLWQLSQSYFCPRSNIHHYLGIAQGAIETIQDEYIKIKKLFYVLRPLLAALWCAEHASIVPMNILPLMNSLSGNLQEKILSLINLKATTTESYLIKIDPDLKQWTNQTFEYCLKASQQMKKNTFEIEKANWLFREIIQE